MEKRFMTSLQYRAIVMLVGQYLKFYSIFKPFIVMVKNCE